MYQALIQSLGRRRSLPFAVVRIVWWGRKGWGWGGEGGGGSCKGEGGGGRNGGM